MYRSKQIFIMKFWKHYGLISLLVCGGYVVGENILVLHPVYAGSHILTIRRISEELAHRGHKIRVIRWKEDNSIPPVDHHDISETILAVNNSDGSIPFLTKEERASFKFPSEFMWKEGLNPTSVFAGGMSAVAASCKTLLENEALIKELENGHFHLAIVDLIYNECGLALAHHLGIPTIGFWALFFMSGETQYTTAYNPPSVMPHVYTSFTSQMNFFERLVNVVYGIGSHLVMQLHFSYTNHHIQNHFKNCPHPSELLSNLSGVLINSHSAFDYAKQLPPSFFHIGGINIRPPKPLPQELKDFFDHAEDGVILMSLGLNFDAESVPKEIFESYFRVFSRLKQKVIVKSNSVPSVIPSNVMILPHVPQNDILAHHKTVLLITHGGMHGVMEAIHFGIKMVAIPVFFDQRNVAVRLVDKGVATMIEKQATEEEIYEAISVVLTDKIYEKNIKKLNHIYQHSFENPMSRAVWLVEHVMEFEGADHLKLPSKDLNFFQFFSLDVFVVLLLGLIVCLCSLLYAVLLLVRKFQDNINTGNKVKSQ